MAPHLEGKSSSGSRIMGTPAAISLMFATLISTATVLERHYSLTEARRDHMEMQLELDRVKDALEENERFLKDYGFGQQNVSSVGQSPQTPQEKKKDCESEVVKAVKRAEQTCSKKLDSLSKKEEDAIVKDLRREVGELKKALASQTDEKAKISSMILEAEHSTKWNEKTLTPKAIEAAKLAISKCGEVYKGMPKAAGKSRGYGSTCQAAEDEILSYLNYTSRGDCPDDWYFVQNLIFVKNCFCLPKRTCFARSPPKYRDPLPFPQSLWDPRALIDDNVRWDLHQYKSFNEINTRQAGDCKNCFNLTLEDTRWVRERHGTIALEKVVKLKEGSLRFGLDVGGGSGSFAAKMAAYNCTILTTAMNIETLWDSNAGLPYMETIALRGLVPLHLPHKARLPFFDNTLDIIHAINSVKYFEIPEFEELIFEWDRVLRPGGIIWFELFYTPITEMPLYVAVLELFNYRKLYWNMSPKTDSPERDGEHVYLNCVLEKRNRKN